VRGARCSRPGPAFAASPLRVKTRVGSLAPSARPLGRSASSRGWTPLAPGFDLPSRASRSSGLRPRGHAAQSAAPLLRRSLRARFAPSLRFGVTARGPRFARHAGLRPPLIGRPAFAGAPCPQNARPAFAGAALLCGSMAPPGPRAWRAGGWRLNAAPPASPAPPLRGTYVSRGGQSPPAAIAAAPPRFRAGISSFFGGQVRTREEAVPVDCA
jgi:hypothetical protein